MEEENVLVLKFPTYWLGRHFVRALLCNGVSLWIMGPTMRSEQSSVGVCDV